MAVATYVRFYNVSWIGERVTADLRKRVFDHLLTLSPGFFEVTRTGEVISRLTNDTTMLETAIGSSLSMALRNIVLGVGALVLLMLTSLKLTLLVLARAAGGACCRSSCSDAACAVSRAPARIALPTPAPTSTRRFTRFAPCRRTRTSRGRSAALRASGSERAFATGVVASASARC